MQEKKMMSTVVAVGCCNAFIQKVLFSPVSIRWWVCQKDCTKIYWTDFHETWTVAGSQTRPLLTSGLDLDKGAIQEMLPEFLNRARLDEDVFQHVCQFVSLSRIMHGFWCKKKTKKSGVWNGLYQWYIIRQRKTCWLWCWYTLSWISSRLETEISLRDPDGLQ